MVQCGWRDGAHKCADAREKPLPEFERKMEWLYSTVIHNRWNIFNQTCWFWVRSIKKAIPTCWFFSHSANWLTCIDWKALWNHVLCFVFLFFVFFFFNFFFIATLFIYLFIFWLCWVFSSCEGFLRLRQVGATPHRGAGTALHRGARAFHHRGPSRCRAQAPDAQAQ